VSQPSRGEIWLADLNPSRGHEQAGTRPVLVVSSNRLNHGQAALAVVVPLTSQDRAMRLWPQLEPPEGGLRERSFAIIEGVRSLSTERLFRRWGNVAPASMIAVEDRLRMLFEL
jgi:mRNA interferase MazF